MANGNESSEGLGGPMAAVVATTGGMAVGGPSSVVSTYIKLVLLGLIICISLVGNLVVSLLVLRDRTLHKAPYYFLLDLCLADTIRSAVCFPFVLVSIKNGSAWTYSVLSCKVVAFMAVLFCFHAAFMLFCISVTRYMAIAHHRFYSKRMTFWTGVHGVDAVSGHGLPTRLRSAALRVQAPQDEACPDGASHQPKLDLPRARRYRPGSSQLDRRLWPGPHATHPAGHPAELAQPEPAPAGHGGVQGRKAAWQDVLCDHPVVPGAVVALHSGLLLAVFVKACTIPHRYLSTTVWMSFAQAGVNPIVCFFLNKDLKKGLLAHLPACCRTKPHLPREPYFVM
ncbi:unnamed protein product [Oncorhynchus mykiss]|uniref:Probable G-protein coupled receptor 173 n=1 Tax=Oncorhynchus mykiss TaxID=8022 RepID=A0A060X1E3_ONCMY|nr:unnamed protein product [Oncorhynchus mykiss]